MSQFLPKREKRAITIRMLFIIANKNLEHLIKSVKLRKLEKNAEQEEEQEQDFKDVEARAAIARA